MKDFLIGAVNFLILGAGMVIGVVVAIAGIAVWAAYEALRTSGKHW